MTKIEDGDDFQDTGLVLAVPRPQTNAGWIAWHNRRNAARTVIHQRAHDQADADLLTAALGLDPQGEADLLTRIG